MIGLYEKLCIMIGIVKNNNKKYMMGFKKVFYNSIKWLEIIGLYEKLCIMIGMIKNNNNKYMMGLFKLFKLYSSGPWVLFNLNPDMNFWIKIQFEYWIILLTKRTIIICIRYYCYTAVRTCLFTLNVKFNARVSFFFLLLVIRNPAVSISDISGFLFLFLFLLINHQRHIKYLYESLSLLLKRHSHK